MGPFAGVIDWAAESLSIRKGRMVRRRKTADRHDAESGDDAITTVGFDTPAFGSFVKGGRRYAGSEHDVLTEIEPVGNVVGISEDLGLRCVFFRPVPLLVQLLREGEGILHALDVTTGARVSIPVPRSAHAAASLIDARREAKAAKAIEHVKAGKTRAHDNSVERNTNFRKPLSFICGVGSHGCCLPN